MHKYRYNTLIALGAALVLPFVTHAQEFFGNFENFIIRVADIVALLIPLAIAIAVLVFIFGIVKFIFKSDNDEARKDASKTILSGLIGIFVIVSLFGLVRILQEAFGVEDENQIGGANIPTIEVDGVFDNFDSADN